MNRILRPLGVGAILGMLALASCSNEQPFIGNWKANNPENVMLNPQTSASAISTTSIEFKKGAKSSDGDVVLSTAYEISLTDSVGAPMKVTGNCRAAGKWELDVDDDDDLLMTYDYDSMKIDIAGDSATVARVRPEVERLFRDNLNLYSVVEDVEVNKDKTTLSMEIGKPDKKVYFKRITL